MSPELNSIFAGAVIAQWAFLIILAIGGLILRVARQQEGTYAAWIGLLAGVTGLGLLAFSSGVTDAWSALLGKVFIPGAELRTAISVTLAIDLGAAALLIYLTGGTKVSPFKELYFFLPILAIFLHQPLAFVISYSAAVVVLFLATLLFRSFDDIDDYAETSYKLAYAVVTLSCFAITSFVGIALEYAH
jgi:hypothetical protein